MPDDAAFRTAMSLVASRAAAPLSGTISVPGDKSISHRALMLGALAIGRTEIRGLLEGEDVLATAAALRAMGADIAREADGHWRVDGVGLGGLAEPEDVIDLGNSGTAARLLLGILATHPFTDLRLRAEQASAQDEAVQASRQYVDLSMRAYREGITGYLTVIDAERTLLNNEETAAQVKSAVLLAGLNTPGETTVIEPQPTRDHTERMLGHFGAKVRVEPDPDGGKRITIEGHPELTAAPITVPGDPSSAAFPLVAALIVPGSEVTIGNVGLNPTRAGLLASLREMGADIALQNQRTEGGEPVVDLRVRAGPLKAPTSSRNAPPR
jgi:3-phosphoshikimate 1-carboxyvinyltransferase